MGNILEENRKKDLICINKRELKIKELELKLKKVSDEKEKEMKCDYPDCKEQRTNFCTDHSIQVNLKTESENKDKVPTCNYSGIKHFKKSLLFSVNEALKQFEEEHNTKIKDKNSISKRVMGRVGSIVERFMLQKDKEHREHTARIFEDIRKYSTETQNFRSMTECVLIDDIEKVKQKHLKEAE